jgi:hypothetical protein
LDAITNVLGWSWHIALGLDLLLPPLALWSRARGSVAVCYFISSFVFGISLWSMSAITTYFYWGGLGLVLGLLVIPGVGVVPMGMLATLLLGMHGHPDAWMILGVQVLLLFLTFGARALGLYLGMKQPLPATSFQHAS